MQPHVAPSRQTSFFVRTNAFSQVLCDPIVTAPTNTALRRRVTLWSRSGVSEYSHMRFLLNLPGALALAALLAFAPGCARPKPTAAESAEKDAPAKTAAATPAKAAAEGVPVEVEAARVGPVAAFLSFNSTLEVESALDVFPEVAGLVEEILVEEGDRVKAGQPLLRLDHDEQLVELKESEVNLAHLEASFRRTEELSSRGLINTQDFETRRYELEQARLRLERAKLRVRQATVVSPVDAVVTQRLVQPGARVGGSTKLFGLMSLDDMIARVHVPGRYLTTVTEDQEARLSSEFLPGRMFEGWVKRISPIVDPTSGTFKVTVGVRPGVTPPPPGLFVNVRIVTDRRETAVLVPKRAIVYEGGERYVFVVADGVAKKVRLAAGYEEGDFVEVLEQVAAGDSVVVLGQNGLKDQSAVRIVETSKAAGPTATAAATTPTPGS